MRKKQRIDVEAPVTMQKNLVDKEKDPELWQLNQVALSIDHVKPEPPPGTCWFARDEKTRQQNMSPHWRKYWEEEAKKKAEANKQT